MSRPLDAATLTLRGQHLIEASAGTGKTHNIALLYLRLLLENGLGIRQIAVVTFTEAATRELRGRLRRRIAEAIERLRDGPSGADDELDRILSKHWGGKASVEKAGNVLVSALVGFDEARISTLHGLCRQLLADHAFETGLPFIELETSSGNEAVLELVRDFWRRRVVAEPDDAVEAVLARWPDPDSFSKMLLRSQVLGLPAQRIDPLETDGWIDRSRRQVRDGRERWRVLQRDGHVGIALEQLAEAIAANLLSAAKDGPLGPAAMARCVGACASADTTIDVDMLAPLRAGSIVEARLRKAEKVGWEPPAELAEVSACVEAWLAAGETLQSALVARFSREAIAFVSQGLLERRARLRRFGFDDLVGELHEQLHGAAGDRLAASIAGAVPALLIDEFQDTDPQQYAILRRIHAARAETVLLLIGDPKQAIYRFRGGDIFTYHAAARDAGGQRHTLRENWRSDAGLIAAANAVFSGVADPFLFDFIGFEAACFPERKPVEAHWLTRDAPLTIWRLPDRQGKGKTIAWTAGAFEQRVLAEVARQIGTLLAQAREGKHAPPSIGILVNSNRQAEAAARLLGRWNIACDYLSTASVYASAEAIEVERLIGALDAPNDAARVRAALATELLGEDLAGLRAAQQDLDRWEAQLARIARLRQRWFELGPYATLAHCVQAAAERLLPRWDGRRKLTNLLHLGELLQQESARRSAPADLLHWLGQRRNEAAEQRGEGHAESLRPADDAGAVQVLTVHRSKGLQFDVVFAPFALAMRWTHPDKRSRPDEAVSWHAGDELRVDIGGPEWQAHALAQREEQFAESLRLAYVAITRARHRVWLCWAYANTGKSSTSVTGPLAWLLLRGPGIDRPEALESIKLDLGGVDAALDRLVDRSTRQVAIEMLDAEAPSIEPVADGTSDAAIVVAEFRGRIERGLETLSYSRLFGGSAHAAVADHDESEAAATVLATTAVEDPVPQWPRGASFGTCVHEVFEDIAFAELAKPGLNAELERICADHGFGGDDPPTVASIARATVRSELLPGSGLRLMDLDAGASLAELEFLFPMSGARLETFARILARFPAYAREAGELRARRFELNGLMTGFIDLILRWQGRYYVLDYKTNLLGPARADYAPERLPAAIRQHDYDLQYLIYLVALQRFLRVRLGDAYDYATHIGGALYLFVRGMREGERTGIHVDCPPAELIDALDAWCAGDRA